MIIKGRVHKFSDNVNTDEIISAKYLVSIDPKELGSHCMEAIRPLFSKTVRRGDIIVAGKNFGCGSSREQAPIAIKGCGIWCVIAESFARIFYRNAINIGLVILELDDTSEIREHDELEIDLEKGLIKDITQDKIYHSQKFPMFMQEIIKKGGLMRWIKSIK
jgi:3-isopropylmalate/(R)-2-methylmalate dehydratase small subunit